MNLSDRLAAARRDRGEGVTEPDVPALVPEQPIVQSPVEAPPVEAPPVETLAVDSLDEEPSQPPAASAPPAMQRSQHLTAVPAPPTAEYAQPTALPITRP